ILVTPPVLFLLGVVPLFRQLQRTLRPCADEWLGRKEALGNGVGRRISRGGYLSVQAVDFLQSKRFVACATHHRLTHPFQLGGEFLISHNKGILLSRHRGLARELNVARL